MLLKNWFFIGMALVVCTAIAAPQLGQHLRDHGILLISIFIAYVIAGLTLDTRKILVEMRNFRTISAASICSLIIMPSTGSIIAGTFYGLDSDFGLGILLISLVPVTVASGTVLTALAKGNVALSLIICVSTNFIALFSIPVVLPLLLESANEVKLPVPQMFSQLVIMVLVPAACGQMLRVPFMEYAERHNKALSIVSQCVVLLVIFNAVSSSAPRLAAAGSKLPALFAIVVAMRFIYLLLCFGVSKILRIDLGSRAAFTIHTSQKTLTVSYVIWSGFFMLSYPLAMLPGIIFHLVQMVSDTFVAEYFKKALCKTGK